MLLKSPGFTAVAVLTLALGIGANTAIFSLADALLLRFLPVRDPHQLVLFGSGRSWGMISGITRRYEIFSYPQYRSLREQNQFFTGICAFGSEKETVRLRQQDGTVATAVSKLVSGNYFSVLGVPAAVGRTLVESDDQPGAAPAVVISYRYWTKAFNRDPAAVGKAIDVNGTMFTIAGVAATEFFGESVESDPPEMWLPINSYPEVVARPGVLEGTDARWLLLMGRLSPGASVEQAQAAVTTQLKQFLTEYEVSRITSQKPELADEARGLIARASIELTPGGRGVSHLRLRYSQSLHILLAIVAVVLLIACANLASLLLARATARRREISIRLALGAARTRLVRQLLTESIVLALLSGAAGLLLAWWGTNALLTVVFRGAHTVVLDTSPDWRMLGFLLAISVIAGVLFGLAPALHASRADLGMWLKTGPSSAASGSPGHHRFGFGRVLVTAQIALSLLLVAGAGLFVRTLVSLSSQDIGFDRQHVLMVKVAPQIASYKPAQLETLYQRIRERVNALPGVQGSALALYTPLSGENWSGNVAIAHYSPEQNKHTGAAWNRVSAGYFETMGIPMLLGRSLGPQDVANAPDVAVVNQTFANRYFPGENPVGQRFGWSNDTKNGIQIVGVAKDTRHEDMRSEIPEMFFLPLTQKSAINDEDRVDSYAQDLLVRSVGDPTAVTNDVRRALRDIDPGLPILDVTTLSEQVSASMNREELISGLASFFAGLALLLAAVGLYGLMAYAVARRTNEIGIRMALGAASGGVLWMVLRETLLLAGIGIVLGIPLIFAGTRAIAAQLYGVRPYDPLTLLGAALVLGAVAAIAGYVPARRAAGVDPMTALRYE